MINLAHDLLPPKRERLMRTMLAVAAGLVISATIGKAASLDDQMERTCNTSWNKRACTQACAHAEVAKGHEHAYDGVSHATQKTCDSLLRAREAAAMKHHVVCDAQNCRIKLDLVKTTDHGLALSFRWKGWHVSARPAPVPPYAGGYLYTLTDPGGHRTRFSYCGSCDISNLQYEGGPLKTARILGGTGNNVVLQLPASSVKPTWR